MASIVASTSPLVAALAIGLAACDDAPVEVRAEGACVVDRRGNAWSIDDATSAGAFSVGTHTETFVDTTRSTPAHGDFAGAATRTLPTDIWYPATAAGADRPIAPGGPFPVVLYSHGFSSTRKENTDLTRHLASRGYVVIAPTFPASNIDAEGGPSTVDIAGQPVDLAFVLDRTLALAATPGSILADGLDDGRVGAIGLSMGGLTTLLVTFHAELRDPRIDVAVAMAPLASILGPQFYETTETPLLVLFGDADAILAYDPNATLVRDRARSPFDLLTLARGTHTGFTSIAQLFDESYENVDTVGCIGFESFGGPDLPAVDFPELLGGEAMGIVAPPPWTTCPDEIGVGMPASRQLFVERAAVTAQLDAYLAPDATTRGRACHFVARVLPREDDLTLDRR